MGVVTVLGAGETCGPFLGPSELLFVVEMAASTCTWTPTMGIGFWGALSLSTLLLCYVIISTFQASSVVFLKIWSQWLCSGLPGSRGGDRRTDRWASCWDIAKKLRLFLHPAAHLYLCATPKGLGGHLHQDTGACEGELLD